MDFRLLRYFVAVAAERSFSKAADRLNMAQPPLSRQIQNLEAEVGAQLIDRSARPLSLTPIGELFFEEATAVLDRAEKMRVRVSDAIKSERRKFRIGFVSPAIHASISSVVREFRATNPLLDVELMEISSVEQYVALNSQKIDAGFNRIHVDDPAISRTVLQEEELLAVLPFAHALALREGPVSMAELSRYPLILYPKHPRPSFVDFVQRLFEDRGLPTEVAFETLSKVTALELVAAGEGLSIVPASVGRTVMDSVTYKPISDKVTSPVIFVTRLGDGRQELMDFETLVRKSLLASISP
ncbi:LysR family transcriptional regulator [Neorhizobium sp. JUb45]|uniref:LysR family transcriptional regulator n=1 Tax=Neorhizobium sp. JUb45 TaxID=2485113 RepID=UPI00104896B1|nr:LysR family transcriptional regulator [Neorhizobium sp. JUb45]TCQ97256.1 LysR family transcriptional regulator [Neorhizobium sp. JUb45]